jgi:hypothetical protein
MLDIHPCHSKSYTYTVYCNEHFPSNDVHLRNATTLDECLDRCASWTASSTDSSLPCEGVVLNANFTSSVGGESANCFLKQTVSNRVLTNCDDDTVAAAVWSH